MDPSDAIVNAILADPGPAYAPSSAVANPFPPEARGIKDDSDVDLLFENQIEKRTKGLRTALQGGITKRHRSDRLPPLPYDAMRKIAEHEITIKSLFDFAKKEFKNFKFEVTTEEANPGGELIQLPWWSGKTLTQDQNVKILFPKALGVLFPSVSWSDVDGVYKLNTLYTIGKLDETYDTVRKKFQFMGVPKNGSQGCVSRNANRQLNVYYGLFHADKDDLYYYGYPQFSEEMVGFRVFGRDQETGFIVRVAIFVAPHDVDETAELKMAVHTSSINS
jgi:hypothetical protein